MYVSEVLFKVLKWFTVEHLIVTIFINRLIMKLGD